MDTAEAATPVFKKEFIKEGVIIQSKNYELKLDEDIYSLTMGIYNNETIKFNLIQKNKFSIINFTKVYDYHEITKKLLLSNEYYNDISKVFKYCDTAILKNKVLLVKDNNNIRLLLKKNMEFEEVECYLDFEEEKASTINIIMSLFNEVKELKQKNDKNEEKINNLMKENEEIKKNLNIILEENKKYKKLFNLLKEENKISNNNKFENINNNENIINNFNNINNINNLNNINDIKNTDIKIKSKNNQEVNQATIITPMHKAKDKEEKKEIQEPNSQANVITPLHKTKDKDEKGEKDEKDEKEINYGDSPDSIHIHELIKEKNNKSCFFCEKINVENENLICSKCNLIICFECAEKICSDNKKGKLHKHPLIFKKRKLWHCDKCKTRTFSGLTFNCRFCDYDVCLKCYQVINIIALKKSKTLNK